MKLCILHIFCGEKCAQAAKQGIKPLISNDLIAKIKKQAGSGRRTGHASPAATPQFSPQSVDKIVSNSLVAQKTL
jgi:hypothetical protein